MAKTVSKKKTTPKRRPRPAATVLDVPTPVETFPTRIPSVQIIFRGLQGFALSNTNCDVGIHNTTHGTPFQPHRLLMRRWNKTRTDTGFDCPQLPSKSDYLNAPPITSIRIHVEQPDLFPGVSVYQTGAFDRSNSGHDSRDFRWTLDLEGPDFFNVQIPNKQLSSLQPIVKIDNGLFFTADRTESKFIRRHPTEDDLELNHIAGIIAANIYLQPVITSKVQVYVNDTLKDEIVRDDRFLYQLDVINDCASIASCGYDARRFPQDETRRNDFYLYYDNFPVPSGKERLELICSVIKRRVPDPQTAPICPSGLGDVSDPSPCVGVVFGKTRNLS